MSFNLNTDAFVLVSAKLKCQILFQGISDATKIGTEPLKIQRVKINLASHFFLWWRLGGILKWLKETSFCERKEKVITKISTLLGRKISYYEFFG